MKILHIITSLHIGGAEKLIVDLVPRLKQCGHSVDVLLFNGADTPFKRELERQGIKLFTLSKKGSVYNPLFIFKLIPILHKYDIIHTHNTAPQLYTSIANLFCRKKLITTEHSTSNRRRNWRWYKPVDRFMYNRYNEIICISNQAESNLRNYLGGSRANISTIFNGVDINKYKSSKASNELNEYAPNCRSIIMVAGFRYQKDQDTLIRATAILPKNFHTFFVGEGERLNDCKELAQSKGVADRVHFLGLRMDVPKLLKAADYVVLSSHWEGLSLASIEGMSVGKPFIASDVDGLHEMVVDAGILFNHQDHQQLSEKILYLDQHPEYYQEVAEKCLMKAELFDISLMTENYNNIYSKCINSYD